MSVYERHTFVQRFPLLPHWYWMVRRNWYWKIKVTHE